MDKEQVIAALFQVGIVLEERSRERGYHIDLKHGYAYAAEEQCFYIRELLSITMKRVGTENDPKKPETTVV